MINQNFVILGAVIFLVGSLGYIIDTIKGIVKPNRVTWFIWSLAPFIAFAAQMKQGVGMESLLTFMTGFVPLVVFISSFANKKSYWKIHKLDIACGSLSVVGLILWQITKVGNIAIVFSLLSDFLALLPTIVKSYTHPETENYWLYFSNGIFSLLTVLAIKEWNFANYAFPIYILLGSIVLTVLVKFRIGKRLQ
jgi:hypothetical protein